MLRALFFLCTISLSVSMNAQLEQFRYASGTLPGWVQLMYAPDPDPSAVQAAYEAYYATQPFVKNAHTQYYKRWKREIGHELVPVDPQQRAEYPESSRQYVIKTEQLNASRAANWSCIGPIDWDHGSVVKSYAAGAAHVYTVEQSVSNMDVIYAGTANAGLWKSIDKGLNWLNVTKGMLVGEVLSIEIHISDPNIVYFGAEGDLFKSIDAGATWIVIGDATFNALSHSIRDIVMHPSNAQLLYVISDKGLWRSTNAGSSFTQIQTGIWQELEFRPNDPNTVYAVKQTSNRTEFWRSTSNGVSFSQIVTGWPLPVAPDEQKRTEIAVCAAAPNVVYALCTGAANGGSGLYGVYKSSDQGVNWTFQCCGPSPAGVPSPTNFNLMGWNDVGQDDGGQYYYDLAFGVDPTNENKVNVCGVQRWVSTDGGVSFTCPAKWSHSSKVDYVHADIHDFRYYGGSEIWAGCDGGVFYSNDGGATFNKRMFGISGTDFWGFGAGGWTGSNVMLGGAYHNGTMLKDNDVYTNGWVCTDGGDGFRGFAHPQYDRRVLSDYGYKTLSGDRNVANGNSTWSKQPSASYITGESSEIVWHPNAVNTAFLGNGTALWRTDDNGASFIEVYDFGEDVTNIDMALSEPNTMYVCTYPDWWGVKKVWRTVDGGINWTNITPNSAMINGNTWVPYDVTVSATDPQTVWLCRTSQYGNSPNMDGYLVYKSVNGGSSWTNITDANLNGEWPSNIVHQLGSAGDLYIGTRRGVYHRSNAAPAWALWNAGLPTNIYSTRLLINYRDGKIRNGTDRSVWESALETLAGPVANFAADKRTVSCLSPDVQFWDNSALNGTNATWSWSFPGGSPATSTDRSPVVSYSTPGVYDVTLDVSDANGNSTRTLPGYITVENSTASTPLIADAEDQLLTPAGWSLENPDNADTWSNLAVTIGADGNATRAWRIDNYYYNAPGQLDRLISPVTTLGGSSGTRLKFHHAYKMYGASYTDGLRVEISTNCGSSWIQLYYAEAGALATSATGSTPWAPGLATDWLLHDIDISAYDGQQVVIRFTAVNDYGDRLYLDNIQVVNSGMRLALKMMLEGAYETNIGSMRDDLRIAALIPALQPYTAPEFVHVGGGGETIQAGVQSITGNNAIVDWVFIELRSEGSPTTVVATRSALLQSDGDVVAEDGISPVSFNAPTGNYFIVARHRNHLGCMTAAAIPFTTGTASVDLTNPLTLTYGTEAQKEVNGVRVLWLGNVVHDLVIKYTGTVNDRDVILTKIGGVVPTNTVNGYHSEDCNMDGVVRYTGTNNDRDPILTNIGGVVPTNVRIQQLP
ncbi:MAG: PKD domain-containing protein [Flavobacteriales bacterium]|nr:PKD domain-containing protein [Flavobacteriales bacterium]